jgi:hypothetical protein
VSKVTLHIIRPCAPFLFSIYKKVSDPSDEYSNTAAVENEACFLLLVKNFFQALLL